MPHERILLIEKNRVSLRISAALRQAGYQVMTTGDVFKGLRLLYTLQPHLVILTRSAPFPAGESDFLLFRWAVEVPVMVIGAAEDAVEVLESGADAYLNIPVYPVELIARVRSLLRQGNKNNSFALEDPDSFAE